MEDTKMKNILDELYDYDLFHLIEIEDVDGSYKSALDRLVKAEAELKKAYPDSTEILDEYQSEDIELHNLSNRNEFRKGFKVGAQLILEMIKSIKWGGQYEQIQEQTDRIQLPEKEIRSAVDTGHQHRDRYPLQSRYADRGEQDIQHRLHQVSSSFLWQPLSWQALQAVNDGRIVQYLDDMERKVSEAISRQVELWKQTDTCYQKAVLIGDAEKMLGLENCFVYMARETVFECMVYIWDQTAVPSGAAVIYIPT